MEPRPRDNQAEPKESRGGTAPLGVGAQARSNLSLPGEPTAAASASSAREEAPSISLQEGVSRARNIAHAVLMIIALLLRHFLVKVVGAQLYRSYVRVMLVVGRVAYALWKLLSPYMARLRDKAAKTGSRAIRLALVALITLLVPLERLASLAIKGAKVHGARLAAQSARTTVQVLRPLLGAIAQVVRAGFNTAVVRKVLVRLINILEEAQR